MRKKGLAIAALATSMILSSTFTSLASWEQSEAGWKYKDDGKGVYLSNGWYWLDGNNDGISESYYLDSAGIMAVNTTIEGYTVDINGAWTVNNIVQTKVVSSESNSATQERDNSSSSGKTNANGVPNLSDIIADVGPELTEGSCGDSTGLPPMEAGTGDNNSDNSDVHWIPDDVKGGNSGGFRPGTIIGG